MCSIELKHAQHKLRAQESEIRSLRDQNKQMGGKGGVDNEEQGLCDSDTLLDDIEKNNVCLHTSFAKEDAEISEIRQQNDTVIEETRSLQRQMNNKDFEISQLRFRHKLLEDEIRESKYGKDIKLCNVLYEKAFLQKQMKFLQEENLKKDEELSTARLELKRAREWKVDMTNNCTLNATLSEHIEEVKNLQETIKHVTSLKNMCQGALDQSLQKESELCVTVLQLKGENKEKEYKLNKMEHRLNRCIGIIHANEAEIKNVNCSWQRKIKLLEARLEQSNQEIIKGKEQAYIAQEKMRKEIQSLKVEIIEKETTLQSIESQVSHSKKINEDQSKSEIEKENAVTSQKQKDELSKETEHFKIKISGKDEVIQELFDFSNNMEATKTEKEAHIIGIVNENRQIVYLRKQLKQSYDEMASLRGNCIQLRNSNQEKVVQISELKDTIEENTRQLQERKSVTAKNYNLLQKKLKHAHNQLKTCKQEIEFEKNKADIEMTKLHSEIKCCNLKIKEQEAELLRLGVDFTNQVELKEREESELNDLYEKETELHKSVRIKETEYEVSEGKNQLSESLKTKSARIKNELKHIIHSMRQQPYNTKAEIRQQQLYISHEKDLMSTKDKDIVKMDEEIESLKLEVKQYKNAVELKQEAESKLNKMIHNHMQEIQLLQGDIDRKNIELSKLYQENDQYKKEIANAKQVAKAEQITISEMGTRINDLISKLKTKEAEQQNGIENLGHIIDSQKEQIKDLEREALKSEKNMTFLEIEKNKEVQEMENNIVELENQIKHMLSKLRDTEAELYETKSRFSCVIGNKLTDNNLNITDLSDRNRPTKIAEKCTELYENDWTYALDVLENQFRTEEAAIKALLLISQNVMHFCKTMARRQIEIIEREMYFADENERIEIPSYIQKVIKDRRKATATDAVGNLKKIYVAQLKKSKDEIMRAALDVEPYTLECIEICWFMLIQDPPVVFAPLPIKDSSFDSDFYEPYTNSGTHIDFAVWPALLLHDGGPILAKGVAQGYEYI